MRQAEADLGASSLGARDDERYFLLPNPVKFRDRKASVAISWIREEYVAFPNSAKYDEVIVPMDVHRDNGGSHVQKVHEGEFTVAVRFVATCFGVLLEVEK